MKKKFNTAILILMMSSLSSCLSLMSGTYTPTFFWVTNSSNKTVNFKAGVLKFSSTGHHEIIVPFSVNPKDTILVRSGKYIKNINPAVDVFTQFIIFPVDSVTLNNPKDIVNWIKSTDRNGNPQFIFDVNKRK